MRLLPAVVVIEIILGVQLHVVVVVLCDGNGVGQATKKTKFERLSLWRVM